MEIRILMPQDYAEYESFIDNHSDSLIYHTIKFKRFLELNLACKAEYLLAIDYDKIVGVLPIMVTNGSLGEVINSLPYYGSNGGVVTKGNKEAGELLLKAYIDRISLPQVASATIVNNPLDKNAVHDSIPHNQEDYRIGQFTRIEGFFSDLESLMTLFHTKTRNTIRKAIKSDVTVEVENEMFEFLEKTHKDNMDSIGGLAKTSTFFASVQEVFKKDVDFKVYVARHNGMPIAALLILFHKDCVEYYTPVVVKEFRNLQALSLIIAKAMLDASKRGYKWWNWGGTWASQDGVYSFKSRWGTVDLKYNYFISVQKQEVYNARRETLLKEYPGFYVIPFDKIV